MIKELKGLRIQKRSIERLGCIKGCLEYLGSDISFPWLYGGTGHAYIISLDPGVDVSSPDSWDHQPQYDLGRNMGYAVEGFNITKEEAGDTFPQKQKEAWDFVRSNIDRNIPCFGFELKQFYGGYWVIYGYDETGYYYSGWEEGGPLAWQKLGDQFITVLEVRSVQLCDPSPAEKTIKDGLEFAIKHSGNPPEWIHPNAKSGSAAWDYWAEALESGEAKREHHAYNVQLWLECRETGVEFLNEVREKLSGKCEKFCAEAASFYTTVCDSLKDAKKLHPMRENADWGPDSTFTSSEAAELIRQAGDADAKGLDCLREIVNTF
jgi:hypothetical protein